MNIEKLKEEYNEFITKVADSISEHIFSIIRKDPNLKSISFVHNYESYWNDDGYSTMGLNEDGKSIVYVDDMGIEQKLEIEECYTYNREKRESEASHPACPIIEEFLEFISSVPENFIEQCFDEGEVIFNADGTVSYDEYECY